MVPEILIDHGLRIEIHDNHFPADSPDEEWLAEVGRRGWFVLSKDKLIRRRKIELQALLEANVGAFIITSGNLTGEEIGETIVKARNRMLQFISKQSRPFIAAVTRQGTVRKIL